MPRPVRVAALALGSLLAAVLAACNSNDAPSGDVGSQDVPIDPVVSAQAVQSNQDFTAYATRELSGLGRGMQREHVAFLLDLYRSARGQVNHVLSCFLARRMNLSTPPASRTEAGN